MITVGIDAHKKVHQGVALDETGRELGQCRVPNSAAGWVKLYDWAASFGGPRQWGIEGAWSYGRGLAQSLIARGEVVYEVNTRWTAIGRRSARRPGKTDDLDANAIALLVMRESTSLPGVHAEDETVLLDMLTSERESLLVEATRLRNQVHALLMQVDPQYRDRLPSINSKAGLKAMLAYAPVVEGELQASRVATIQRIAGRLDLATSRPRPRFVTLVTRAPGTRAHRCQSSGFLQAG
jgi:transposase